MIKKLLFLGAIVLVLASCGEGEKKADVTTDTVAVETVAVEVLMSDFEEKAADLIGKEIKITGIVDHVCKHGGKKILLVDGDNSLHVFNDERYDEALSGSSVSLIGVVEEERIDSAWLAERLKHEMESHGGEEDVEHLAQMKEHIQLMQDSLVKEGVDHFSNYSLKYVSHTETK